MMLVMRPTLFPLPEAAPPPRLPPAKPRVQFPNRSQSELRPLHLDGLLAEEHTARAVWAYVERLDVQNSPLYEAIRAVEGGPGRPPIDPRIMLALWLYATLEGIGSARELDRLCKEHVAYQWICGGVGVNYHALADFRVGHGEVLERLLTHSVAVLVHGGIADLKRAAQDGVRVRASAGAASFRRESTLNECLGEAKRHVEELRREVEADPAAPRRRERAAKARAAEERVKRIEEALRNLPKLEEPPTKPSKGASNSKDDDERGSGGTASGPKETRASTTDPDARVMKMADGGFRPAFNVQFVADTKGQVILGVDVSNSGSDRGKMAPMLMHVEARCGQTPSEWLVDGGFPGLKDIEAVAAIAPGTAVYAPVMKPRSGNRDPHVPMPGDSPPVAAWRLRMGTPAAAAIYKQRGATIECVNAIARNRGLRQFLVRGLEKVRAIALWFALAHNVRRSFPLVSSFA